MNFEQIMLIFLKALILVKLFLILCDLPSFISSKSNLKVFYKNISIWAIIV